MKINREPDEPRFTNPDFARLVSRFQADKHCSTNLRHAVRERGYRHGLFRGSFANPFKAGVLRNYWHSGCLDGIKTRREAKENTNG